MPSTYSPAISSNSVVFKTIAVDGLNIAYREAGDPSHPKLVLLHGWPASSHLGFPSRIAAEIAPSTSRTIATAWLSGKYQQRQPTADTSTDTRKSLSNMNHALITAWRIAGILRMVGPKKRRAVMVTDGRLGKR